MKDFVCSFYSHEGLLLEYEEALTKTSSSSTRLTATSVPVEAPYVLSAHTIWLGDRTRQLDGAHIEFFRGIRNPIGIKVGPTMKPDELVRLLEIVDPLCEKGRVTLICRYGAQKVSQRQLYLSLERERDEKIFEHPA